MEDVAPLEATGTTAYPSLIADPHLSLAQLLSGPGHVKSHAFGHALRSHLTLDIANFTHTLGHLYTQQ